MSWRDKVRPYLLSVPSYEGVTPPEAMKEPGREIIKLDGNENLYGCSPHVREALSQYSMYHLYSDPEQRDLRQSLAAYTGVGEAHILAGNGSDELIDLILRVFLEPGDKVLNLVPTFGMYSFSTRICAGEVVDVEREADFSLNVPRVKKALTSRTKVIFIASPNNPTGNLTAREDIEEIAKTGIIVVVDEAYFEFCDVTALPLMRKYDNVLVLRTFSKWAGLAGLRLGYGIFPAEMAGFLRQVKPPYNINRAAQVAAIASLNDLPYLQSKVKAIIKERERLFGLLQEVGWLEPYPSQANFILARVLRGQAAEVHQALKQRGIFIRYYNTPRLKDYLRFSIGLPQHSDALIEALKQIS